MYKKFIITLSCLSLIFPLTAAGQTPALHFDRITTENTLTVKGLSQNSIYSLIQDSRGFIWIGTWDGLNRYDGYDYIVYNTANGLSHPTINSVIEDDEQNIWIGTDDGLNRLNRSTGKIDVFHHNPENPNTLSNDYVNHILQDKQGYLWISTAEGLNRYDKQQGIFTVYNFYSKNTDSTISNFISCVEEYDAGTIWIGTHSGIHRFDIKNQEFKEYKLPGVPGSADFLRSNYIRELVADDYGQVYAGTLNGVFLLNPIYGVILHLEATDHRNLQLSSDQVNSLLLDRKGVLWIGTNKGLNLFNPITDKVDRIVSGINSYNLSNEDIRSIYQDNSGTIWVGTYKGLNKVDLHPGRFLHLRNDPEDPNSLSDNIVYSILEDEKGLLWIGTYDGVNLLDREQGQFTFLKNRPGDYRSLSSNKIRTLALDSAGFLWIGTESDGINRLDRQSGDIKRFYNRENDNSTIAENNILSTMVDSKGRIWIGTVSKGLTIINSSGQVIRHISARPGSDPRLSDDKIWVVYEDKQGNFWIGSNMGVHKLSPDLDLTGVYRHDQADPNSISSNMIFSILEDREGIFWMGTMGGGLNRYDPVTQTFKTYNENSGLPNNVVYTALEDEDGNLWITTNRGVSKFDQRTQSFVNYDTQDGVQGNEFNTGAYFKNVKGEIFFGGMNGINIFHPNSIVLNKIPPRMAFTGLKVLNDLVSTDLENGEVIRLNHNENFFAISFSGLDYTNPSKNIYRYKLENYDEEWIVAGASRRTAEYRKVEPGTYRFIVTGANNDGVWNEKGIGLTIVVRNPWWRTWVFRLLSALFLITVAWSIVLVRIRSVRKKHDVEKKMLAIEKQVFELEQKALRLQMNPHFIFNSLNAIQNFVLANDTDRAVNYLAKFSHLMRMILANSTASLITLKDELRALTHYIDLEKLRFDDKFDYVITHDQELDEEFVEIPPMLFQPYVENAIIHGLVNSPRKGLLEVSIKKISQGTLLCSIRDNGIGREKAIELRNMSGIRRQPKGMIITQERIEIFNKQNRKNYAVRITDLRDDNGEAAGTLVEFTIQYRES
ncbi:MAG: histidine kinase [Bacteroidales bacterium]|nr:histidine kinase [Bacteroidales bacterium]